MLGFLVAWALNWALMLDFILNVILLGAPGETVSHRVARLRAYGYTRADRRLGCTLCNILSAMFWFMHRDHCTWAMSNHGSIAREIWHWSN